MPNLACYPFVTKRTFVCNISVISNEKEMPASDTNMLASGKDNGKLSFRS